MGRQLAQRAGSAVVWRSLALAGEKLIFLLRLVILARILVPEDFGLVAIAMAALVLAGTMTDFGIVPALVRSPATDKLQLDTAWTISLTRGVLVSGVLFLGAPFIASAFGEQAARPFVQAIGATVLLRSAASIRIASLNRDLHFRALALLGLISASINTAVSIVLAPSQGAWSMIWGSIAGAATFMLISFVTAPYRPVLRFSRRAAASIIQFGRWIFLIGIIAVLSNTILRVIISRQLGVVELGLFFMAARLGFLPAQLISEIVGSVAFPVYAQLQANREKATNMYRRVLVATMALMIPVCAIFTCLVPALVSELLGERWQGTVTVMQLLILSSVVGVLGDSVIPLLKGIGRPAKIAWMDIWQFLFLIVLAWFFVDHLGLVGAGLAWVISVAVTQVFAYVYARRLLLEPFKDMGLALMVIALSSVAAALVALGGLNAVSGLTGLLIAGLASALTAILCMIAADQHFGLGLRETLAEPFPWTSRLASFWRRYS